MIRYIADESIETAQKQIDEFGTHRFLRDPEMEPRQWSTLQLLDSRMLKHAWLYGNQQMRRRWGYFTEVLLDIEGPQHTPPGGALLVQQIQSYHDEYALIEVNRLDIECIITPSILGLKALDIDRRQYRTEEEFAAKVSYMREIYYDLVTHPTDVETKYPGITVSEMLTLIDSFHLLQPVRDKIAFKCNCKDFFRCGICPHSTLFKMVWYPDEIVPDDYSVVKIAHRASTRRAGVFDKSEPTFQDKPTAQKQVWKPTGMAGMSAPAPFDDDDDDDFVTTPKRSKSKAGMQARAPPGKQPGKQPSPAHEDGAEPTTLQLGLDFLRSTQPPKRYYSPPREIPARIAAMSEAQRYHFTDWLSDLRKRRAQVRRHPPPCSSFYTR
jgi:hypothetical protein